MKITQILFLLFMVSRLSAGAINGTFQLIPQPQSIEKYPGKGIAWNDIKYICSETEIPVLSPLLDALPQSRRTGIGVELIITDQHVPESPEGYILEIISGKIKISARDKKGLFYGCQTLEQLMEDSRDFTKNIPFMKITDYPTLTYRAVHFDNKHHLSRMEYFYKSIDRLARYKINAVIWEIEDKLKYTRRPEVASPNAISKQEIQALCRYARERNVEISPLIQGLGHAGFVLKHHWELRENPESDWEFCPSDPRTYEVQFDLYRDALEAMPYGKYLHVGGDEITAIGIDERCKATGKTAFQLQMEWLEKVCKFAVDNGRIPIFWDDMPLKYGGLWTTILGDATEEELAQTWNTDKLDAAIELFPKDCIYMRWNYDDATKPAHRRILQWYRQKGLKVMAATAASSGNSPFLPRENTKAGFIKGFSSLVAENQLEGILATAWDDGSPHLETVWRGYIAQGEFGWNPNGRSVDEFKKAHAQREYGFGYKDNTMNFLDDLEETAFFFDDALVTSGRRNPAWGTIDFKLIGLPDENSPGQWSVTHKEKIDKAKSENERYEKIQARIQKAKNNALRNRYTLEVYEQTNHLLNYPTRLILALYDYDNAKEESTRGEAREKINEVCDYFYSMRSNLEKVYSKTRFMEQPEGYIADMNHHNHLSAKTLNSDWWYLYELPMTQKVKHWMERR